MYIVHFIQTTVLASGFAYYACTILFVAYYIHLNVVVNYMLYIALASHHNLCCMQTYNSLCTRDQYAACARHTPTFCRTQRHARTYLKMSFYGAGDKYYGAQL